MCLECMVPPIKLCINGHNICSKCRERVQCCPTCRAEFSEIRNVFLENIVTRQKYPCVNKKNGCLESFYIEHIAKHQAGCVYGNIKCPLHLLKMCSWSGFKSNLKEHAKAEHPRRFLEGSTLRSPGFLTSLTVISCFGELFTYYKQKKEGRYYAAVQLIGTSSETSKYKCEFTLRAENSIEQISNTFLVRSYSEDFEAIFNSKKCFILDKETAKFFVADEKLKMVVTLSTV